MTPADEAIHYENTFEGEDIIIASDSFISAECDRITVRITKNSVTGFNRLIIDDDIDQVSIPIYSEDLLNCKDKIHAIFETALEETE